ncbi:hypothetical protein G4Y79_15185 [Phototrophicus methaneseepsis]|uniref:Uncharacterized protein n=1 Tax=Phototrophicus methaneseepsis TaxID=2710758 RepID=A0A7S8ID07_9CHLR|nr:hypothetical protein [Phototrophicus methaneseepsis]QPC81046.1 hypothetical protein G4Y79_15185 [Phototrophicus methaneseepsis]
MSADDVFVIINLFALILFVLAVLLASPFMKYVERHQSEVAELFDLIEKRAAERWGAKSDLSQDAENDL